jgi:thiosulfate dehydrogenase
MKFLLGLIIGVLLLPAAALLYLNLGYAPVATSSAPLPFEATLTRMALQAKITKEAPAQSPVPATEANLLVGAKTYREYCASCHGLTGDAESAISKGMFPVPPQLLHGKGMMGDPVGETYWKVANGIRLTGMPSFRNSLIDEQIWQVSQFVANADKLPASVREFLAK